MKSTPNPDIAPSRDQLLERIASIATMQPGTLTEEYRDGAVGKDGKRARLGPYFKLQVWRDGANRTCRVPASQAQTWREDIGNYHEFNDLCGQLAELNIEHTRALRATRTPDADSGEGKKLRAEADGERFAETEAFISKTQAVLRAAGPGESPEWIEQGLRDALLRDGCKIIAALYNDRSLLPDDEKPQPFETRYRNRNRRVHTLFGEIGLRRNYHHHAKTGTGRCPLDDLLGLEGSHTPAVARLMCRAATRAGSYQEASDDLSAYAGLQLDPRDLGRMVAAVAPGLREALVTLDPTDDPKPAPIPVLYVSCDGTGTPMRREELEGIKGKQQDGSARTREAKLGCVFTQTVRDDEGKPLRDPGSTSYTGTYQGCREVAVLLHQEARRRGLDRAKQIVYIGDGAAWVWENCRLTFPGAIEILDFYHASEHVGQLATAIHDSDPSQAAACRSRWCHDMKQTSPAALLAESHTLLDSHPEWGESKREAIQLQINYLESHASRTRYGEYQAKGWFIGSGVVEAGCKTVVGRRLKQSGMFWSQTGAEDILSLRCLVLGPHFDTTWKARRQLLDQQQTKSRRWSSDPVILPS